MTAYLEGLGYASYLVGEHDLLHLTPGSLAGIGSFKDWRAGTAKTAGRRGVALATLALQLLRVCKPSSGCSTPHDAAPVTGASSRASPVRTRPHGAAASTQTKITAFDHSGATCLPCARRCPSTPGWCCCSTDGSFRAPWSRMCPRFDRQSELFYLDRAVDLRY